jgi:hypothetical protein
VLISVYFFYCFFGSVLTSNRHQTTWFCPSAATQLRAGLRLPIGCTTIQPVPRNESCAVPRHSRGLLHPSQTRRTTGAHALLPANPVYLLENSRCFVEVVALVRLVTVSPWPGVGSRLGTPYLFLPPISRPPLAPRPASPPCPVMPSPRAASLPCHCSSSDSPGSSKIEVFHALKAYNFRV